MIIRVGLTTGDLVHTEHARIHLSSQSPIVATSNNCEVGRYPAGEQLEINADDGRVNVSGQCLGPSVMFVTTRGGALVLSSDPTAQSKAKPRTSYHGALQIS